MPDVEDDEVVEISDAELASLRANEHAELRVSMPSARGWSTPTFACHRNVSSCTVSCCCPCVQFGLNQRSAFGESCIVHACGYIMSLLVVFAVVQNLVPATPAESVLQMAEAEVEDHVAAPLKKHLHRLKDGLKAAKHAHGAKAAFSPPPPPPELTPSPTLSFSTWVYFIPAAMLVVGLLGMLRRRKLRQSYGIAGSAFGDFVCHCCCHCCSLAKEAREIRRHGIEEALEGAQQDLTTTV